MDPKSNTHTLKFKGSSMFRARLVLSILSGRPVRISAIREFSERPGVNDEEVSFIRLLDKLTNGTRLKINETGTVVSMVPGFIQGGKIEHECSTGRSISYYLEAILPLCPFAKRPIVATFTGVTDNDVDVGIDNMSSVFLPVLGRFAEELRGCQINVEKRGAFPGGGGVVQFSSPIVRSTLKALQFVDPGKVNRVRGVAHVTNLSPQLANRMVDAARSVLNKFCADVYIRTDHRRGEDTAGAPGYGLSLVGESTTWSAYGAHRCAVRQDLSPDRPEEQEQHEVLAEYNESRGLSHFSHPEDIGQNAAKQLIEEIVKGGAVDTSSQWLALILMVLCPEDVSKLRLGKVSQYTISYLRLVKEYFGIEFRIVQEEDDATQQPYVVLSCLGVGFHNISRKVT